MRPYVIQESALPRPGMTEAIESGCTCHFVGHVSNTDELEPAGMLMIPDANCPLHGTAAQRWPSDIYFVLIRVLCNAICIPLRCRNFAGRLRAGGYPDARHERLGAPEAIAAHEIGAASDHHGRAWRCPKRGAGDEGWHR